MNPTFFVLEMANLPFLLSKELPDETIAKYELEEIENQQHIYASVVNLNTNDIIRTELEGEGEYAQLRKSVLMYIGINIEIRWKKNVKILALSQYSEFSSRGVANDLSDVKFPS